MNKKCFFFDFTYCVKISVRSDHSKNRETGQQHHCVYQYSCSRDRCNSTQTYIGYTTCIIFNRFKMHTQNSSSIKKHLSDSHQINKISTADLILNTKMCPK